MSYIKELNKMTFSFSRLHMYEQCPYAFYLKYIEKRDGESNFYAENGKCMHEVFENLFTDKTSLEDCPRLYNEKFDLICETVRPNIMENTYMKCIDYLCEMDGLDKDTYEIIGVEMKLEFKIGKYKFQGYADLVVRNKKTGEVILVDHKQATHFMKKDGVTPLKNQLENFIAYKKQMYLYCKGLLEQHGIKVSKMIWNHFKDGGLLTTIPYIESEMKETEEWAINLIETIKKDKQFAEQKSYMTCRELCDFRNDCEFQDE